MRRRAERGQLHRRSADQDYRAGQADRDAPDEQRANGERDPQRRKDNKVAEAKPLPDRGPDGDKHQPGERCGRHDRARDPYS